MIRWNTKAIVLDAFPAGESDRVASLVTPRQGRVRAVAKGALKSKKRFVGLFDLAQLLEIGLMIAPRTGRVMVEHATLIEAFPNFREHPLRLARASLLLEIVSLTVPEHHSAFRAFDLLSQGLFRLHSEPDSDRWAVAYAYRLLSGQGYRPRLESCVCCRRETSAREVRFSASSGGVICPGCAEDNAAPSRTGEDPAVPISLDTVKTLCAIMSADSRRLIRIQFTKNALNQSRRILGPFMAHHLVRPSRALQFMEKIA